VASVQLRLGFAEPTASMILRLEAVGMTVNVEYTGGTSNDAHAYLAAAGCAPSASPTGGVTFPMYNFLEVSNLPAQVELLADATLRPLLTWIEHPSDDDLAAELEVAADGSMWMSWRSNDVPLSEDLTPKSAAAVLTANLPFVASDAAFQVLKVTCPVPLLVGSCSVDRDGFIRIETSKPQLLESMGLTGLFRIDETTYGLPFPGLSSMQGKSGLAWSGPMPRLETGPRHLPQLSAELSRHAATDLKKLVDALASFRTQLVAWESGLGRRVFVLAALEALDAFPAVVVCRPDRVWQWWRHAGLFDKSASSLGHAEVRIVTYEQFATAPRNWYGSQALVFDDVTSPEAAAPEVAAAAIGVGGMLDCYLVGISDDLPTDPRQLVNVMSRLRPAEFSANVPLIERYGTDLRGRLVEHASSYVSRRVANDPGQDRAIARFNHTQVQMVEMSRQLKREYEDLENKLSDPDALLEARQELCSVGSKFSISPKVSAAMDLAHLATGRRLAIVSRNAGAAAMLTGLLAPRRPQTVMAGEHAVVPPADLVIVTGEGRLPDLSRFDEVVSLDYPDSYTALDEALGDPEGADSALRKVTILHIAGTVDDDLAVLAALNAEHGTTVPLAAYLDAK
jgi:hypothetical protein